MALISSSGNCRHLRQSPKLNFIIFLQFSLYFFLLLVPPPPATSLSFNFSGFNHSVYNSIIMPKQDASLTDPIIDLTRNRQGKGSNSSVGGVLYNAPVQLWDKNTGNLTDFTTHFSFTFTYSEACNESLLYCRGDGLAFFLAPYGSSPVIYNQDFAGGGLGLFNNTPDQNTSYGPKDSIVAVEFDTYRNQWDPDQNHIGIDIHSIVSVEKTSCDRDFWSSMRYNGFPWEVSIGYNSSSHNLNVLLTCADKSVPCVDCSLNYNVNLKDYLPEQVTVGFSAATGESYELHQLNSWAFSSSLEIHNSSSNNNNTGMVVDNSKKKNTGMVVGLVVGGAAAMITVFLGLFLFFRRRKKQLKKAGDDDVVLDVPKGPKEFSFDELAGATGNFDEKQKLGEGGFGGVYRGFLSDDHNISLGVAVKRISKVSKQGINEYASEVKIISRLRHRNLVQLVGWCHQRKELLLVYEFMPNGSLDSHLFQNRGSLAWELRYKIALDLASALHYLHEGWDQCVVHRDIKSSNVILDSNFNAKLGDFGLARLVEPEEAATKHSTNIAGTMGYMAPEYVSTGKSSKESDVYSFGIVLLEIACGRKALERTVEHSSEVILVDWVWELYGRQKHLEVADPSLGMDFDNRQLECMVIVGLWCAQQDYLLRPSIGKAINVLKFDAPLPILQYRVSVPLQSNMSSFSITSSHGSTEWNTSQTQRSSNSYTTTNSVKLNMPASSSSSSASLLNNTWEAEM